MRFPPRAHKHPDLAIAAGGTYVQDFINGTAFGRGVEQVLLDIATDDPVFLYIVERRHRFYMAHIERILDAARGRIDLVLCGDDFGSQRGLLISPAKFRSAVRRQEESFSIWSTPTAPRCRITVAGRAGP